MKSRVNSKYVHRENGTGVLHTKIALALEARSSAVYKVNQMAARDVSFSDAFNLYTLKGNCSVLIELLVCAAKEAPRKIDCERLVKQPNAFLKHIW